MKSYRKLIFIFFFICLIYQSICDGPIRHIKSMRNTQEKFQSIFQNATVQKSQKGMKLYLKDRVVNLLNVPDVMQATDYTCGPSSLLAVLSYFQSDEDIRESDLAIKAKTNSVYGTSPQNLYSVIRSLGINAEMKQHMTISDLEYNVQNNMLTIILFQAWADAGTDYKNDWSDGHYVVVIGYDKDYLYFEDPWILGSIGYIPKNEFLDRWHDIVAGVRKVYNLGIVVRSDKKQKPVIVKLE